jgi:hypothetical protein
MTFPNFIDRIFLSNGGRIVPISIWVDVSTFFRRLAVGTERDRCRIDFLIGIPATAYLLSPGWIKTMIFLVSLEQHIIPTFLWKNSLL